MKRKEADLLLKASFKTEKVERDRIAQDLHDCIGTDLYSLKNSIIYFLQGEKEQKYKVFFEELIKGLDVTIENTRQISYKIMPPSLEILGFVPTIIDFFKDLSLKTGLDFSVNIKDKHFDLDSNNSYEMYRVIQEFTTNMQKYGSISKCSLVLYVEENNATIEIIDDGIPYDFKQLLKFSKGAGVKNINGRLKAINAKMEQQKVTKGNHFLIQLELLNRKTNE